MTADLSAMCTDKWVIKAIKGDKSPAWNVDFSIEIMLGTTELEARLVWTDNVSLGL